MRIARLISISANLLIFLHTTFMRLHMDYTGSALNALKIIQNCCLPYPRRAVNSSCITKIELRSRCNIVSTE